MPKADTSLRHYFWLAEAGFEECAIGDGLMVSKTPPNYKGLYDTVWFVLLAETVEDHGIFPTYKNGVDKKKKTKLKLKTSSAASESWAEALSAEYRDIFSDLPGKTGLIQSK